MRGRKPKPTKLKLIEGNRGKRKINRKEPQVPAIMAAKAPDFLDLIASMEWNRQMKVLIPMGYIGSCDLGVLSVYCEAFSHFVRGTRRLKRMGDVIVVKGKPIQNPWIRVVRDARRDLLKAASELGISPSSRSRVTPLDFGDFDPNEEKQQKLPKSEFFED